MSKNYYIYIMMSNSGTLYIGMTGNLKRRVNEHKIGKIKGFTQKYKCKKLVYFENYLSPAECISREKQLKKWNRSKKLTIISNENPKFVDLYASLD